MPPCAMSTILAVLLAGASVVTPGMAGTWDMKAGDTVIFRLEIADTPAGPTATWVRPDHFETDGERFSHVGGPVVRRQARSVQLVDGDVEVSFDDPAPNSIPDTFRLHRIAADQVKVTYEGTGMEPFVFVRAKGRGAALGPWDANGTYVRTIVRSTNAEMTAIFDADQAVRKTANIDWKVARVADEKRRMRTQALLDAGALNSGDDFYHAAFVFQHGGAPNDYLKAHLLAMVAVARGRSDATWIAAATLDRYLQSIDRPQVLGTQYALPQDAPATQEPYDRALIPDAMRQALHVPTIAEQEKRRQRFDDDAKTKTP